MANVDRLSICSVVGVGVVVIYSFLILLLLGLALCGGNTERTATGCLGTVNRYGSKFTGILEPTQGAELFLSVCLSLSLSRKWRRAKKNLLW